MAGGYPLIMKEDNLFNAPISCAVAIASGIAAGALCAILDLIPYDNILELKMKDLVKVDGLIGLIDKFLAFAQVKTSSVKAYRKGIKNLSNFFNLQGITTPTRESILAYREYLSGKYAPATCNLYLTSAKLFFNFLSVEGYISFNPAERVKGFKISSTHKRDALSTDMTKKIISSSFDTSTLKGKRDKAMYLVMSVCALRTVEVSRARIENLRGSQSGFARSFRQGKSPPDFNRRNGNFGSKRPF